MVGKESRLTTGCFLFIRESAGINDYAELAAGHAHPGSCDSGFIGTAIGAIGGLRWSSRSAWFKDKATSNGTVTAWMRSTP
jgi:hypothetical protein